MTQPNGPPKGKVQQILAVLAPYKQRHAKAKIDVCRKNAWDIRVRIIDPDFARMGLTKRLDVVEHFLEQLPDEVTTNITQLVLVTPDETQTCGANLDFEDLISRKNRNGKRSKSAKQ